jgi:hypothetical protein
LRPPRKKKHWEGLSMAFSQPPCAQSSRTVRSVLCDTIGTFSHVNMARRTVGRRPQLLVGSIITTFLDYPFRVLNIVGIWEMILAICDNGVSPLLASGLCDYFSTALSRRVGERKGSSKNELHTAMQKESWPACFIPERMCPLWPLYRPHSCLSLKLIPFFFVNFRIYFIQFANTC